MGPHCLPLRLLKHFRQEKQMTFVVIGALRVKVTCIHPVMLLCAPLVETKHFTAADTPSSWTANT